MSDMWGPHTSLLLGLLFTVGGFILGRMLGRARLVARVEQLETLTEQQERLVEEHQRSREGLWSRNSAAEEQLRDLQVSILQIPEIAQRLAGVRELREIPEHALDLVQEIFDPSYAVFYRVSRGLLVAVSKRGESEFNLGHELEPGAGIVGWTAVKQLALTPEEADLESAVIKQRHLLECMPRNGFALTLPIVAGDKTLGVILVGPTQRVLPHAREIGRTIALMTAITIQSTMVLRTEQELAKRDGLTGLLNKTHITQMLVDLVTADEPPSRLAVFLCDIDHFKNYNDTNGHLPGDELLKGLGSLLKTHSREGEHIGRYGGEEFLVVLENATKEQALAAAERVRRLVAEAPFEHRENQPAGAITISGGVATWPNDAADVESLLRAADDALYQAKRAGRNRVVACTEVALGSPSAGIDPDLSATLSPGVLEKVD